MSAVLDHTYQPSASTVSALLLAAVAGLLIHGLGGYGLLDNNEGLYAAIGWDMLRSGDYLIPRVGGLPYIEKPPLLYWLLAGSFAAFGKTAFAARLVPALAGLAQVGLLLALGRIQGPGRTGLRAGVVLATSAGFYLMARTVMFDMVFAAFLNAALVAFYLSTVEGRRFWQPLSYLALALAVLAKGFVALALYFPIVFLWAALQPPGARLPVLRRLSDLPAVGLFLAVAVPWHVLASLSEPGFAWFYFINEHLLRYLGLREPRDYYSGSPFYHLPRLLLMLAPWSFFLPLRVRRKESGSRWPPLERFFLLVALFELAFFSLSSAKANYYLVIALPPLAWLVAAALERSDALRVADRPWLAGVGAVAVLWPLLVGGLLGAGVLRGIEVPSLVWFVGGGCAAGALALAGWYKPSRSALVAGVAVGAAATLLGFVPVLVHSEAAVSSRSLALAANQLEGTREVFVYRDFERLSALAFYLERPLRIVDSASMDLDYARKSGAGGDAFPTFATLPAYAGHGAIVVSDERRREFEARAAKVRLMPIPVGHFDNGTSLFIF